MVFSDLIYEPYNDLFNFSEEIKTINPGYRLFYNRKNKSIEILNINNFFEKCHTFYSVCEINLQDLRFCKIENLDYILNKLDLNNQTINTKNIKSIKNKTTYTLKEFFNLNNRSTKINNSDINKIIGATQC